MKTFGNYHPAVLACYFISVLLIAMFVWNPVIQLSALTGAIFFCVALIGGRKFFKEMLFYIPFFILVSVTNPLFSHNGETPLFFMNGNPVTLEAIAYGAAIGVMVMGVMLWCKCMSMVMTSDKILYILGGRIPGISLILSMALRFIPMFVRQTGKVNAAQKTMGLYSKGGIADKAGGGMRVMSSMITYSLENAVDVSASMKSRGYGTGKRTSFFPFKFTKKDLILLLALFLLVPTVLVGVASGKTDFHYYPKISYLNISLFSVIAYSAYVILAFLPFVLQVKEEIKWKFLISKI